jgi:hypothetical protein
MRFGVVNLPEFSRQLHLRFGGGDVLELVRTVGSTCTLPSVAKYDVGDLVANSATNTAVVAITFIVNTTASSGTFSGLVQRVIVRKLSSELTNAFFRVHLFFGDPAPSPTGVPSGHADHDPYMTADRTQMIGYVDVAVSEAFSTGSAGVGTPIVPIGITGVGNNGGSAVNVYALIEARAEYTPGVASETFVVVLEVLCLP